MKDGCAFKMAVEMTRFGATGGASSSPTKSERDSADVKAYKCIQMIALRKVGGIVRMLNKQSVYKASVVVQSKG